LGTFALAPGVAAPQESGGEQGHGDLFGDLVEIKRDLSTGQPILQKRMIEYPEGVIDWGYCPIPVDVFGLEIPFIERSCEYDPAQTSRLIPVDYFGRLSGGRAKERNLRMHFDEVIIGIQDAEVVDLDTVGRVNLGTECVGGVCAAWKVIDSPFANLGLYHRLLKYGHIQTHPLEKDVDAHGDPELGTVYHPALSSADWAKFLISARALLPRAAASECFNGDVFAAACAAPVPLNADDFALAASALGGAADKHGRVTMDLIQYLNRMIHITQATAYSAATLATLPALIRDENGVIAAAAAGLPAPADERFLDYGAASYTREARFSRSMSALMPGSAGTWVETSGVSLLPFLRVVNGAAVPLDGAPGFVANAMDAIRATEFVHEFEIPADLVLSNGAFTRTTVVPQVANVSDDPQSVLLTANIVDGTIVSGGAVTFTVMTAAGAQVGASVTSGEAANGAATASFVLPANTAPGVLTVLAAYSGTVGFAASYGMGTLTILEGPCTYAITPTTMTVGAAGGLRSLTLQTNNAACTWTPQSDAAWLTLTDPALHVGDDTCTFEIAPNDTGMARLATISANGATLVVTQSGEGATEVMDFNGDGRADLFAFDRGTGDWTIYLADGVGSFSVAGQGGWRPDWVIRPAEFSGDGLTDFLLYRPADGEFVRAIATGLGAFTYSGGGWYAGLTPYVVKLDTDAVTDVLLHNAATGEFWAARSIPGTADFEYRAGGWAVGWEITPLRANDGSDDLLLHNPTTGAFSVVSNLGGFKDPSSAAVYTSGGWAPGWSTTARHADVLLYNKQTGQTVQAIRQEGPVPFRYWSAVGWPVDLQVIATHAFRDTSFPEYVLYMAANGLYYGAAGSVIEEFVYYVGQWPAQIQPLLADFTGDGLDDALLYNPETGQYTFGTNRGADASLNWLGFANTSGFLGPRLELITLMPGDR
jgi:hypothetical protein